MKDPYDILMEVLAMPDSREIMKTALTNMIEGSEERDITTEDLGVYLCSAAGWNYYTK